MCAKRSRNQQSQGTFQKFRDRKKKEGVSKQRKGRDYGGENARRNIPFHDARNNWVYHENRKIHRKMTPFDAKGSYGMRERGKDKSGVRNSGRKKRYLTIREAQRGNEPDI